jgi:hypothetical protein
MRVLAANLIASLAGKVFIFKGPTYRCKRLEPYNSNRYYVECVNMEEIILKVAQLFECDPIYTTDGEDLSVDDFQMINSLCRLLEDYHNARN